MPLLLLLPLLLPPLLPLLPLLLPMLLLLRVFGVVEVEIGLLPLLLLLLLPLPLLPLRIKPHPSSVSRRVVVAAVLHGGCRIGTTCNKYSTKKVKEKKKYLLYCCSGPFRAFLWCHRHSGSVNSIEKFC